MFPLRRRTAVVGERGDGLARGHVRVVVLHQVVRIAARGRLPVPAGPAGAAVVTRPAVPAVVTGADIASPVMTGPVMTGPVMTGAVMTGAVMADLAVASVRCTGPIVARPAIAAVVTTGVVIAGTV